MGGTELQGEILDKRYEIVARIAEGAMGMVYRDLFDVLADQRRFDPQRAADVMCQVLSGLAHAHGSKPLRG